MKFNSWVEKLLVALLGADMVPLEAFNDKFVHAYFAVVLREMLDQLFEKQKDMVMRLYGIDRESETQIQVADALRYSASSIKSRKEETLLQLKRPNRIRPVMLGLEALKKCNTPGGAFAALAREMRRAEDAEAKLEKMSAVLESANQVLEEGISSCQVKARLTDSVDVLDLSVRTRNCLIAENISSIVELVRYSALELLMIKNMGRRNIGEIEEALASRGLHLSMKV